MRVVKRDLDQRDPWWAGPTALFTVHTAVGLIMGIPCTGHWRGVFTWSYEAIRFVLPHLRDIPW